MRSGKYKKKKVTERTVLKKKAVKKKIQPVAEKIMEVQVEETPMMSLGPIDPAVQKVIKQAFVQYNEEYSPARIQAKDMSRLQDMTTEYLSAYMTIGYDLNGEKIFHVYAKNDRDYNSLVEHLRMTFIEIANKQINP